MKIKKINDVDPVVIGRALNLNDQYFKDVNIEVALYQSRFYGDIELSLGEHTPAVLIPKEEFQWLKRLYPEISELEDLFVNDVKLISWIGTAAIDKYDPDHVISHELKHVQQRASNIKSFYKDRLLSFLLKKPPTEIDADDFAGMTLSWNNKSKYDWIEQANMLFEKKMDLLKTINESIENKDKIIKVNDTVYLQFDEDANRELFKYFFSKI